MEARIVKTPYNDATGTPAWHLHVDYLFGNDLSHQGWMVPSEGQADELAERLREACSVLGIEVVSEELIG